MKITVANQNDVKILEEVFRSGFEAERVQRGEYLVYWENDQPVGHVLVCPPSIECLEVIPDYQRLGVATMLVNLAESLIFSEGYDEIELHVGVDNAPARSLYKKLGYKQKGKPFLVDYIPVPEMAIHLSKKNPY